MSSLDVSLESEGLVSRLDDPMKLTSLVWTALSFLESSILGNEPGKVVLTIDNPTSKKKKLLYRSKAKSSTESI